jgi:hypothetical protein
MMKYLTLLFLAYTGLLSAQSFEIPAQDKTFYDIFEWKGVGALLLSKMPQEPRAQVRVTLVKDEGKSSWDQVFNPMVEEVHYIAEEGGKYVYFLESLEPKAGKIFFHQLSIAGNVKSTNTVFKPALDKLGKYNLEDMTLLDIVNTDKALVYLFKHEDKTKKMYSTIAVSMTHHNFLCYATLIAENVSSSGKVEDMVSWYVAGENAENIIFAARTLASKESGWNLKEITPKGIEVKAFAIGSRSLNFVEHNRIGYGRRGSALLNRVEPSEKGTLVFAKGNYYVTGIEVSGTTANLVSYTWKNDSWNKTANSAISNYSAKKTNSLGFLPLQEGIGFIIKNASAEGHFHFFDNQQGVVSGATVQQTNNPSRLFTAEYPNNFVVGLPTKWLVFSKSQLPVKGAVKFEYMQR